MTVPPSAPASAPLAGLRVVELGTGPVIGHAGWLLSLLGADVVLVEPPGGHPDRRPARPGTDDPPVLFEFRHGGKRSAELDLSRPADREALRGLTSDAHAVVEALGAGVVERSVGLAAVRPPHGVLVRISPFGQTGPWADRAASDLTLQAASGWVLRRDEDHAEPTQVGAPLAVAAAGAHAAVAAVLGASLADLGTSVVADLSLFECYQLSLPYPTRMLDTRLLAGQSNPLERRALGVVRCADGWVGINILTAQQWADVCVVLGLEEYTDRWAQLRRNRTLLEEFDARARAVLASMTAADIVEVCQAMRVPANVLGRPDTMTSFEHWRERGFFVERHTAGRSWRHPSAPWRFSRSRLRTGAAAAPRSGPNADGQPRPHFPAAVPTVEHGTAPGTGPDTAARPAVGLATDGTTPAGRLRVVDLTSFWAGPFATCLLGAQGADVIKVESVQRPDGFRYGLNFREFGPNWFEHGGGWQSANLNKRDLTLDLTRPSGRALIRRLLADADVVCENYSTRVLDSFGLGWEEVHALNPALVMVRIPGFGLSGPWSDHVGFGNSFEQIAGAAWLTGPADAPPTTPGGYADSLVGVHAALAILAALRERERSGMGQLVEVPQIDVVACTTAEAVIHWSLTGEVQTRQGNNSPLGPQGVFESAATGTWVAVSAHTPTQLDAVRALVGVEPDSDPEDTLTALRYWMARQLPDRAVEHLDAQGVPAAVVETTESIRRNPQLQHRGYWQVIDRPATGAAAYPGWPYRFEPGARAHHRAPAPTLGQHNEEILGRELALSPAEIADLAGQQVIGTRALNAWPD